MAVLTSEAPEVERRLIGELRFSGFEVAIVPLPSPRTPRDLADLAQRLTVVAAIAVDRTVVVWVVDPTTNAMVERTLAVGPADEEPRELAVRTVELLHASLADVERRAVAPPPTATSKPPPPAAARTPRLRWGATIGVAVGAGPGDLPVAAHARVHLRAMPHPIVGLVLQSSIPLHNVRIAEPEGTVKILTGWVGLGPRIALRRPDRRVIPELAATVGPVFVGMTGDGAAGYQGATDRVIDASFEVTAALEIAATAHLRVRIEAGALTCAREIRVRVAGRTAATWCRPHAFGGLAIGGAW